MKFFHRKPKAPPSDTHATSEEKAYWCDLMHQYILNKLQPEGIEELSQLSPKVLLDPHVQQRIRRLETEVLFWSSMNQYDPIVGKPNYSTELEKAERTLENIYKIYLSTPRS